MANNDFSAQVTLGGITFNTYAADAVTPVQKWFADLDGWDAAPRRPVTLANVTDDGEDPVAGFLAPRPITMKGLCQVNSATPLADLKAARERLLRAAMILPTSLTTLSVADPVPTSALVYGSADAPTWEILNCQGGVGLARFQFGLIAPDPSKFSTATTTTVLGAGIATPVPVAASSSTGGSLGGTGGGFYAYRVSAVSGSGETAASAEVSAFLLPLSTPGKPTLTFGFGGSLPNVSTQAYRVSALNSVGETLASTEAVISHGGSAGSSAAITVSWSPVSGATSYNVYGRTAGSELKIATGVVGTSFVDTGAVTPSGALPSSNTTGTTTGSVTLAWSAVTGATGYNVYGRVAGFEQKLTPSPITATTFSDDGSVTPSGAVPAGGFATVVTNNGTYRTRPVLTVAGPATNPIALTINGQTLQINTAVASGHTLVVDTGAKTIALDLVLRMDLRDNASSWPVLLPGANAVVYTGGGTASLAFRDAYA